jgi:hypothetical protein
VNAPRGWAQIDQRGSFEVDLYSDPDETMPNIMLTLTSARPVPSFYALSPDEARSMARSLLEMADHLENTGGVE